MARRISQTMAKRTSRALAFQQLEDRRLLTGADIVFLVDESQSDLGFTVGMHAWLKDRVFAPLEPAGAANPIAQILASNGITDVRYGLIGFGGFINGNFGRSYVVDANGPDPLFGTAVQMNTALENVTLDGDTEDGWDAFEHLVAEYNFRTVATDGSPIVPIAVLLQNVEGRNTLNQSLVREGVLAALQSKNIVVNAVVYGSNDPTNPVSFAPVFDLTPYGGDPNVRILGVEADVSGYDSVTRQARDAVPDGRHNYIGFNKQSNVQTTNAGTTVSEALQVSFNGSNTGETGMVGNRKSILFSTSASSGLGSPTPGYRATSIPFEWENTTGTGSSVVTSGSLQNIGFTFQYFGGSFTQFRPWQDGVLTLGSTSTDPGGQNPDLSFDSSAPESRPSIPLIAALWDDLIPALSGSGGPAGTIRRAPGDFDGDGQTDVAIEWSNYAYRTNSGVDARDRIFFQVVLHRNGTIQINYQEIDSKPPIRFEPVTGGASATVGLWTGAPVEITLPAGKFVPGPHSIFGAYTSFDVSLDQLYRETNDSYIRLAWDTGGAVWDLGVIDQVGIGAEDDVQVEELLRNTFVQSIAEQILLRSQQGKTFGEGQLVTAINFGSSTALEGFIADTTPTPNVTTTEPIDVSSNSIPFVIGTTAKVHDVFQSARTAASNSSINQTIELADGRYVVELLFAEYNQTVTVHTPVRSEGIG